MEQQLNVLSPFLGKAETLLVLLVVLLLSVAWLLWEIFSFVHRESEEGNHDWWEALKNCPHRRLIIPVSGHGVREGSGTAKRCPGFVCMPPAFGHSTHTNCRPPPSPSPQPHCVEEVPELGTLSRLTTVRMKQIKSRQGSGVRLCCC